MRVLPDVAALDKAFDYAVPDGWDGDVRVGTVVRVSLHGRRVGGWVVADGVTPPAGVRLQPLAKVTGWGPPAPLVDLARWAAWRWAGPVRAVLRSASPPGVVRGLPPAPGPASPATVPGVDDPLVVDAVSRQRAVVRLPPAADPLPFVVAAARRGAALVLAPSVAAAAALAGRLRRAGVGVALAPRDWARAAAGGSVVVGARAAAWSPLPDLAAVVVVDAHDEAYREERSPTWNGWEVAAERARRGGVPCILLSACPTLEQLAWGELVAPSRSAERAGWPAVEVVDRRSADPRSGLYSERVVALLRGGGRVACILNRKGRAQLLACAACGEVLRCEHCDGGMAQCGDGDGLRCRRCARSRVAVCQGCGAGRLRKLRPGVTRVREELEALSGRPVAEITGDSHDVADGGVLVGTEALLHRLRGADAVVFLDFDQELLAPRFRAAEQALALLARAARQVGGRAGGGRVLVQTRVPGSEVLRAAVHADAGRLAGPEAARRAELRLPPATALAVVSGDAAVYVGALGPEVEVIGPTDGRWLVRAPDHATLAAALAAVPRTGARLRVEVDPSRV